MGAADRAALACFAACSFVIGPGFAPFRAATRILDVSGGTADPAAVADFLTGASPFAGAAFGAAAPLAAGAAGAAPFSPRAAARMSATFILDGSFGAAEGFGEDVKEHRAEEGAYRITHEHRDVRQARIERDHTRRDDR